MFGLWLLVRHFSGSDRETLVECRHCGTAVEPGADRCSACGHDGIATYEIE
ncbi:hypothetical protein SAMN05216559_1829 [Halomicrobium zhouii]|uniref:Zinc-ribbon domain-containing protein n=1 Tax=Halomicrobium zhouii TaxID=767519 RepID=A0A1I6L1H5_9EURY|nr:hypothetical protein SAMN05216559_1829 [Halomicrobium zhouii]